MSTDPTAPPPDPTPTPPASPMSGATGASGGYLLRPQWMGHAKHPRAPRHPGRTPRPKPGGH